jgi:hypothetical protein
MFGFSAADTGEVIATRNEERRRRRRKQDRVFIGESKRQRVLFAQGYSISAPDLTSF